MLFWHLIYLSKERKLFGVNRLLTLFAPMYFLLLKKVGPVIFFVSITFLLHVLVKRF